MYLKEEDRRLVKEWRNLAAALAIKAPFTSSILRKMKIVLKENMDASIAVTEKGEIYINKQRWQKLSAKDKIFVASHEALHVALRHLERGKKLIENKENQSVAIWSLNMSADSKVNDLLYEEGIKPETIEVATPKEVAKLLNKDVEKIKKWSMEKIFKELYEKYKDFQGGDGGDGGGGSGGGSDISQGGGDIQQEQGDTVLQEGDVQNTQKMTDEELQQYWNEAVASAAASAKIAGKETAAIKRCVEELFKPKVRWQNELRRAIIEGMGNRTKSTWYRVHRKGIDELPGIQRLRTPDAWVLVDTSGSIDDQELKQFLGEIYGVAKNCKVTVIPWDTQVYDEITVRSPSQVASKVSKYMKGGGGTEVTPALQYVKKNAKKDDVIIILTDGEWFDEMRAKIELARMRKFHRILVTTHNVPDVPVDRVIKISL